MNCLSCRLGAFVMHSAENEFFAHVFHCSPDAGLFCQTIRAACKVKMTAYLNCLLFLKFNLRSFTIHVGVLLGFF